MTTQRDFIATADLIRSEVERLDLLFDSPAAAAISRIARGLADQYASSNSRFDRQRFYRVAGLDESGHAVPRCSDCGATDGTVWRDQDGVIRCEPCSSKAGH